MASKVKNKTGSLYVVVAKLTFYYLLLLDPLELGFWTVVNCPTWVLGIKLKSPLELQQVSLTSEPSL